MMDEEAIKTGLKINETCHCKNKVSTLVLLHWNKQTQTNKTQYKQCVYSFAD